MSSLFYETVKKYYLFCIITVLMNKICSGLWTKSEHGLSSKYWMPHETVKFIMLFQYDWYVMHRKETELRTEARVAFSLGGVFFGNAGRMQQYNI